jgi:hypothetical protein
MSVFWQKYLSLWSGFVVVFGVVLAGASAHQPLPRTAFTGSASA